MSTTYTIDVDIDISMFLWSIVALMTATHSSKVLMGIALEVGDARVFFERENEDGFCFDMKFFGPKQFSGMDFFR